MDGWLAGLIGGLIATVAMTVVMMPGMKGKPPPPAYLFAKLMKKEPASLKMAGMIGHLAYGSVAGLVFGLVTIDVFGWTEMLWLWGILFAGVLMVIMGMIWAPITGMMKEMMPEGQTKNEKMMGMMGVLLGHVVYGVVLGFLVGVWAA